MEYIWKRMIRSPLRCLFAAAFAAAVAAVLCGLAAGKAQSQASYREVYRNIDVVCTLTNATGDANEGLWIEEDVISQFTGADGALRGYARQVDLKGSKSFYPDGDRSNKKTLVGITSLGAETRLLPENKCSVTWLEGYDETIFSRGERLCLLPQSMWMGEEETELEITFDRRRGGEVTVVFAVAGVYEAPSQDRVYCSWDAYRGVAEETGDWVYAEFLRMVLADNDQLEEFRAAARELFPAPDPSAADGDLLALDINDDYLTQTSKTLERSLRTNEITAGIVLVLSACVGFLSGFLLIHSRKREIFLQRVLGTPLHRIALGFLAEQLSMAVLGVALGGAWFRWVPLSQLALFVLIFGLGLLSALAVFLHNGLMTAMKEDT